jgi:hypothetical protein
VLFTCPGPGARGGESRTAKGRRRHLCIDVHCHVHHPPADGMVKDVFRLENEPAMRFTNDLSRATNKQQAENVLVCLTSVEQRLRDMDADKARIMGLNAARLLKIKPRRTT